MSYLVAINYCIYTGLKWFFFVTVDKPGSPGEPEILEVGGNFVNLSWDKPTTDGGGRIQGYFVEKKDPNSDNWQRVNTTPVPANTYNVAGLIEDREYEFRVFAVNEAGLSKPSSATRKVKVKDPNGITLHIF